MAYLSLGILRPGLGLHDPLLQLGQLKKEERPR
jgi:hypothetical protein